MEKNRTDAWVPAMCLKRHTSNTFFSILLTKIHNLITHHFKQDHDRSNVIPCVHDFIGRWLIIQWRQNFERLRKHFRVSNRVVQRTPRYGITIFRSNNHWFRFYHSTNTFVIFIWLSRTSTTSTGHKHAFLNHYTAAATITTTAKGVTCQIHVFF